MAYGSVLGQTPKSPKANEVEYSNASTSPLITSNNVQGAIDQLFTSVSNGKNKIAGAITDKGVSTSSTDSFEVMAGNIKKIPVGGKKFSTTFECPYIDDFGAKGLTINFNAIGLTFIPDIVAINITADLIAKGSLTAIFIFPESNYYFLDRDEKFTNNLSVIKNSDSLTIKPIVDEILIPMYGASAYLEAYQI